MPSERQAGPGCQDRVEVRTEHLSACQHLDQALLWLDISVALAMAQLVTRTPTALLEKRVKAHS